MPSVHLRPHRARRGAAALGVALMLALAGCSSAPAVEPSGHTTEVTVTVQGMHYIPDVIEVPLGDQLIITLENTGTDMHDLVLANGAGTDRLAPGESAMFDAGVIGADTDGWCTVSNHRAMGMELEIVVVDG